MILFGARQKHADDLVFPLAVEAVEFDDRVPGKIFRILIVHQLPENLPILHVVAIDDEVGTRRVELGLIIQKGDAVVVRFALEIAPQIVFVILRLHHRVVHRGILDLQPAADIRVLLPETGKAREAVCGVALRQVAGIHLILGGNALFGNACQRLIERAALVALPVVVAKIGRRTQKGEDEQDEQDEARLAPAGVAAPPGGGLLRPFPARMASLIPKRILERLGRRAEVCLAFQRGGKRYRAGTGIGIIVENQPHKIERMGNGRLPHGVRIHLRRQRQAAHDRLVFIAGGDIKEAVWLPIGARPPADAGDRQADLGAARLHGPGGHLDSDAVADRAEFFDQLFRHAQRAHLHPVRMGGQPERIDALRPRHGI